MDAPISNTRRLEIRLAEEADAILDQLDNVREWQPIVTILVRLKMEAVHALSDIAGVDAEDAKTIRSLQNKMVMYGEFLAMAKRVFDEGIEARMRLSAEDRQELRDLFVNPDDAEAEREAAKDEGYDD